MCGYYSGLLAAGEEVTSITGWSLAGVAALVITWLLRTHIPRLMDDQERRVTEMLKSHEDEQERTRREFREALALVVGHCEKESVRNLEAFSRSIEAFKAELSRITGDRR